MNQSSNATNHCPSTSNVMGFWLFCAIGAAVLIPFTSAHAGPDCTDPKHQDKPACRGDEGGGKPAPFSVAVVKHEGSGAPTHSSTLYHPADVEPTCIAQTNGWNAVFPRHDLCATLTTTAPATITDDIKIIVSRDKKSGEVLAAQVKGQDTIGSEGLMHISEEMVDGPVNVTNEPDGSLTIHLHADNVILWKCDTHLLKRQSICDVNSGTFALDDLFYFPDP